MEPGAPQPRDDDAATGQSWQGQVLHVSGRGSDDSRGLSPVHEITLSRTGSSDLVFGPIQNVDANNVRVGVLGAPDFRGFEHCPICGVAGDLTREHVPQDDLGGRVMTLTCRTCNNRLGSRVERELKDWFDDAIVSVRFSGGDIPGRRRAPRILLRTTAEGEFGMFFDTGKSDADIGTILDSGQAEMHFRIPITKAWRMAALKHAYLGACLALGEIPDSPMAQRVRADLVAARDSKGAEHIPESRIAGGLRVARSYRAAQGPTVVLAALLDDEGVMQDGGLSFAGTLFVSWPLEAGLFWKAAQRLAGGSDETEH